jgi:hypothetical protein
VSCACEITHYFPVAFFVVRSMHKFDFRLLVNEANDGQWYESHAVIKVHISDRLGYFPQDVVARVKGQSAALS